MIQTKQSNDPEFLSQLTFEPLSEKNWGKFVQLFGKRCACGNCWCIWPYLRKQDFQEGKENDGNKSPMKDLVRAGFEIVDRTSKNRPMVRLYTNRLPDQF